MQSDAEMSWKEIYETSNLFEIKGNTPQLLSLGWLHTVFLTEGGCNPQLPNTKLFVDPKLRVNSCSYLEHTQRHHTYRGAAGGKAEWFTSALAQHTPG